MATRHKTHNKSTREFGNMRELTGLVRHIPPLAASGSHCSSAERISLRSIINLGQQCHDEHINPSNQPVLDRTLSDALHANGKFFSLIFPFPLPSQQHRQKQESSQAAGHLTEKPGYPQLLDCALPNDTWEVCGRYAALTQSKQFQPEN